MAERARVHEYWCRVTRIRAIPSPYAPISPRHPALIGIEGQILGPPPKQDLVAYGRVVQRDGDGFWSDSEVVGVDDGGVIARGTVLYRIVT